MVYKKYIWKGGKRYGPYTYHSRRVNGKVVSEYHGSHRRSYKKILLWVFGVAFLLAVLVFAFNATGNLLSGKAVFGLEGSYTEAEGLDGFLRLNLKEGELIPADSKVVFETDDLIYEYTLSDLILDETVEGDFYAEGKDLSGNGFGYGVVGGKKSYSDVNFVMGIYSEKPKDQQSGSVEEEEIEIEEEVEEEEVVDEEVEEVAEQGESESEEETESEESSEEVVEEVVEEVEEETPKGVPTGAQEPVTQVPLKSDEGSKEKVKEEKIKKEKNVEVEEAEEEVEVKSAPITGEMIRNIFGGMFNLFRGITGQVSLDVVNEVDGAVSGENDFTYELLEGQTAKIISSDQDVDLSISDRVVTVSTDYSEGDEGFGEDYLGGSGMTIEVDLIDLGTGLEPGAVEIKLVYGEEEIISFATTLEEGDISVGEMEATEIVGEELEGTGKVVVSKELSSSELEVLSANFDNFSVGDIESSSAEVKNDRLFTRYELGDYWVENTYKYNGKITSGLKANMEIDKARWLKGIANSLGAEESEPEDVLDVLLSGEVIEEESLEIESETSSEVSEEIAEEVVEEEVEIVEDVADEIESEVLVEEEPVSESPSITGEVVSESNSGFFSKLFSWFRS